MISIQYFSERKKGELQIWLTLAQKIEHFPTVVYYFTQYLKSRHPYREDLTCPRLLCNLILSMTQHQRILNSKPDSSFLRFKGYVSEATKMFSTWFWMGWSFVTLWRLICWKIIGTGIFTSIFCRYHPWFLSTSVSYILPQKFLFLIHPAIWHSASGYHSKITERCIYACRR